MKRRLLFLLTSLILAVMLAGCGNPVKTEEELMDDLNSTSQFFKVEGSHVEELSIIKRLTDEDNRTDKVYVSILIDHHNATESRAYVMNYSLYNDGWHLDDIEDYYGDEVVWKVSPKGAPSTEQVMDELIAYSNAQIDAAYAEQWISLAPEHCYFFEDGKYATKIYSGNFLSDTEYSCVVETDRLFNYVLVHEKLQLDFVFDNYSYKWKILSDEILHLDYGLDCYIDGNWQVPSNGAIISFSEYAVYGFGWFENCSTPYSEYEAKCTYENTKYSQTLRFLCPSSQVIDSSLCQLGEVVVGPICIEIEVSPDAIWCYDWFSDTYFELVPIDLRSDPPELERTGIIDMTGNP